MRDHLGAHEQQEIRLGFGDMAAYKGYGGSGSLAVGG
jgi:hypothetical protein